MSTIPPFPQLLCCLVALALAPGLSAARLDPDRTLEIELSNRGHLSMDELVYFTQAVERVFKKRGYPGKFTVDRWSGANQSDEGPVLDLSLIRWGTWTPVDFECRFYATAIAEGERIDLGVFVGRADNFAATQSQREERLVASAGQALERVYDALLERKLVGQGSD